MAENDITVTPEMAKRLNTDLLDICTDMAKCAQPPTK